MKTVLMRTARFCMVAAVLVGVLALAGCGDDWDDHDDYTETYNNCQNRDYGDRGQYTVCCKLTCDFHWHDDHYTENCTQSQSCTSSTGADCPSWVLDQGYPPCPH